MSSQSNPYFPENIYLVGRLITYLYPSTVDLFFFFFKNYLKTRKMAVEDFWLLIVKIVS